MTIAPAFEPAAILATLARHRIRFVVIGGWAASTQNAGWPPLRSRPDIKRLRSLMGPQLFRTRLGRLDVLKEAGGETYESLVADAVEVEQAGYPIACASLAALVRMKQAANRAKDKEGLAALETALLEQQVPTDDADD